VEYLERVGGNFSAFLEAFKWVENNAESDTEYTLRVEKDETRLPHLTVGLNSKNGADNVSLRLRGSAGGPWILEPEDVHFTSFTQIEHVDENDLGDATGFLDIGHMVGIQPARTFILGSNIIIKSGLIPGTPTGSAVIFINVWFNATLVLEPGSEITGHRVTRGNGFIRIGCHNPNPDKDPTRHGKLRILGGAITNCMIQEDRGLLSFTGDPSYVSDGAFYLAPGNVFRLSGNTGATGGDQVNAVAFGITTLYPITEEYLTNGVSMPPVPTE
jgi:hypothetical protein